MAYLLSVLLPAAALALHSAIGSSAGSDPTLVLFLVPIVVCGYLGGLGPGLLATAISALESDFFFLRPQYNLFIESLSDRVNWSMLLVFGTLISMLNESLHRSQRKAEASASLQSVTLASIGDAVITTDNVGRVSFLNAEAERLTGWTCREATGELLSTVFQAINEASGQKVEDPLQEVLRGGAVAGLANHTMLVARDGQKTPISNNGAPIRQADGVILGAVLVFRDCSEQKKAEQSLRERVKLQEQLTRIAATAPGVIHAFKLRPDGTTSFVYANRKIEDVYGIPLEGLTWDADKRHAMLHPDDVAGLAAAIEESKRNMSAVRHEFRVRNPKRGIVWVETHSLPEIEPDGSIQWHGFMQDVTARKLAEAELEQAHKELVSASHLAGMAEMATGVLHNVGNVLNSVNVAADLIANTVRQSKAANLGKAVELMKAHHADLSDFLTRDTKGCKIIPYLGELADCLGGERVRLLKELEQMAGNIQHVKEIVSLQQNAALSGGRTEILDVAEVVDQCLKLNGESLSRRDIEVVRDYSQTPRILVDRHKLLQVLVNLVRNAQQACEESSTEKKTLRLQLAPGDGQLLIRVADNGVGIPPDNLARIFTHGFTTKKDGHGFGLHSSLIAAKEMGGSLTAQSGGLGKGSTFTLQLPIQDSRTKAA